MANDNSNLRKLVMPPIAVMNSTRVIVTTRFRMGTKPILDQHINIRYLRVELNEKDKQIEILID